VSSGKATPHELSTIYGLEDLHDILEVLAVDARNETRMAKVAALEREAAAREQQRRGR
jgi:hypothetical protein